MQTQNRWKCGATCQANLCNTHMHTSNTFFPNMHKFSKFITSSKKKTNFFGTFAAFLRVGIHVAAEALTREFGPGGVLAAGALDDERLCVRGARLQHLEERLFGVLQREEVDAAQRQLQRS